MQQLRSKRKFFISNNDERNLVQRGVVLEPNCGAKYATKVMYLVLVRSCPPSVALTLKRKWEVLTKLTFSLTSQG